MATTVGPACAAVAVAAGSLVALTTGPDSAPIVAVGGAIIDATPEPLKDFAIRTFGEYDKIALLVGIGVMLSLISVGLGRWAIRRPWVGYVGLAVFGSAGAVAASARPGADWSWVLPSITGAVAAGIALYVMIGRRPGVAGDIGRSSAETTAGSAVDAAPLTPGRSVDRRAVLVAFGVAGIGGATGLVLGGRDEVDAARDSIRLPAPASGGPAGRGLDVPGITPYLTPAEDFYRVDTALVIPRLHPDDYTLTIGGRVANPVTLDYRELLRRPMIEREITLSCVSNEVGGGLAGNARWLGVPLADLLAEVVPEDGADQIVGRSADGWTCGTPTDVCRDGRDAMLAVGFNGVPLPLERGFPVRMIVPGLYGYVSATKWLVELELSSFADFDPYWVQRDWAALAPVKTFSRIDTPKPLAVVPAGGLTVAGIAYAQHRGISAVEIRIDGGPWTAAELAPVISSDTWRQWKRRIEVDSGRHTVEVRATDHTGRTQPEERARPFPDGATGWHSVVFTAE